MKDKDMKDKELEVTFAEVVEMAHSALKSVAFMEDKEREKQRNKLRKLLKQRTVS